MALSPADLARASPNRAAAIARSKALTSLKQANSPSVQSVQSQTSEQGQVSSDDVPVDLDEQRNEHERNKYVKGKKLGEGTYAIVYKGHLRSDPSNLIAIKKIKVNADFKDGLTMDAIREVKFLQELNHPNIIKLHGVFSTKDQNLNLVLEFLPLGDLEMLIKATEISYVIADIKAWMVMLSRAIYFCHSNYVLHRDIKPNNLLIAANGEVKLADFGLARSFADPYSPMTHNVVTRWYRPPELFYRARYYSGAVDVWSVGTVFAELLLRGPFLPGDSDINQLEIIIQAIGQPTEQNWPGVTKLEGYMAPEATAAQRVRTKAEWKAMFPIIDDSGLDLLMKMLMLDPRKRPTAKQVLQHPWWTELPRPSKNKDLPKKGGGEQQMGEDLKRRGGEIPEGAPKDKVARKLDFSAMRN